jgi:hypothetical protein
VVLLVLFLWFAKTCQDPHQSPRGGGIVCMASASVKRLETLSDSSPELGGFDLYTNRMILGY